MSGDTWIKGEGAAETGAPLNAKDARWGARVYIVPGRRALPEIGFDERRPMLRGLIMAYVAGKGAFVVWNGVSDPAGVEGDWFDLRDLVLVDGLTSDRLAAALLDSCAAPLLRGDVIQRAAEQMAEALAPLAESAGAL